PEEGPRTVIAATAELFPGLESVPVPGGVTVAVSWIGPFAPPETVAWTVNVTVPPARRAAVVAMFPVPDAAATCEPGDAVAVHWTPVRLAGKASAIGAARTSDGPLLVTVTVRVSGPPAATAPGSGWLMMDRSVSSAAPVRVSTALLGVPRLAPA